MCVLLYVSCTFFSIPEFRGTVSWSVLTRRRQETNVVEWFSPEKQVTQKNCLSGRLDAVVAGLVMLDVGCGKQRHRRREKKMDRMD